MIDFKCTRCGYCCTHLMTSRNGVMYGLYLSPSEATFFPAEYVSPLFKDNNHIFAYQLNVNICPHFKDGTCNIYENRPLGCRAFPLKGLNEVETNFCSYTKSHKNETWNLDSLREEQIAIQQQLDELEKTPEATEMYIFNQKKWITHG